MATTRKSRSKKSTSGAKAPAAAPASSPGPDPVAVQLEKTYATVGRCTVSVHRAATHFGRVLGMTIRAGITLIQAMNGMDKTTQSAVECIDALYEAEKK
jgi:hypothetical protein